MHPPAPDADGHEADERDPGEDEHGAAPVRSGQYHGRGGTFSRGLPGGRDY